MPQDKPCPPVYLQFTDTQTGTVRSRNRLREHRDEINWPAIVVDRCDDPYPANLITIVPSKKYDIPDLPRIRITQPQLIRDEISLHIRWVTSRFIRIAPGVQQGIRIQQLLQVHSPS